MAEKRKRRTVQEREAIARDKLVRVANELRALATLEYAADDTERAAAYKAWSADVMEQAERDATPEQKPF